MHDIPRPMCWRILIACVAAAIAAVAFADTFAGSLVEAGAATPQETLVVPLSGEQA